ncbi:competence type IV pilus ATPase ComGA [Bacillus solitudinis]|uniref:competence type IV pilus ATPase ComGA n=1 Tax=Bacillus solitudinis TaxID=2014074 RepID=UPI0012FE5A08|nr:competence type IV pilus ATPase ComGA [Bacillus solitudinis]
MLYEIESKSKRIIADALECGATDIHFIPITNGYYVQYRVMGVTGHQRKLDLQIAERLVSHFKYQSGMDIGERRKPQSNSMKIECNNSTYDLRISTLPTRYMESMAIRILPQHQFKALVDLPLYQKSFYQLLNITYYRQGLCLITGPTGSGKTTTLYALLEQIRQEKRRSIITIEDPIERPIDEVIQMEVNLKAGVTFANGLRAALRHDPDVMMVGEIRDSETAELAVRASLTGHLVFATLHSSNCYQAVLRMVEYGISKLDLIEACRVIISQRLIVKTCPTCNVRANCVDTRYHERSALYELLNQDSVERVVQGERPNYRSLIQEASLAWALGYMSTSSIEGFDRR